MLKTRSNPTSPSNTNLISYNQVNFISKGRLTFQGIKHNQCYFLSNSYFLLIGIQLFTLNGQMKIMKKLKIDNFAMMTFMNTTNQFIVHSRKSIDIWKLDNGQNWKFYKTISWFQDEKNEQYDEEEYDDYDDDEDYDGEDISNDSSRVEEQQRLQCHGLSANDDLLVTTNQYKTIKFWEKTDNDNWKCQQTLTKPWDQIRKFSFNEQGNILIAKVEYEVMIVIFCKNTKNGNWEIIDQIESSQYSPFCFLNNQMFAHIQHEQPIITFWEIRDDKIQKFQDLQLSINTEREYYYSTDLNFIQSKENLLALNKGVFFLIKRKNEQKFEIQQKCLLTNDLFQLISNFKKQFLLVDYIAHNQYNYFKISLRTIQEQ